MVRTDDMAGDRPAGENKNRVGRAFDILARSAKAAKARGDNETMRYCYQLLLTMDRIAEAAEWLTVRENLAKAVARAEEMGIPLHRHQGSV